MEHKQQLNLASYLDQTLLKPEATQIEIEQLIQDAKKYQFATICLNPYFVKQAVKALVNCPTKVCTVVGFPLGANTTVTKVFEAQQAISEGAREIDMVINIGALKQDDDQTVLMEMIAIKKICPANVILKVIVETSKLTESEKIRICQLVTQAQVDYIKTSTGFGGGGATIADIKLFKQHIGANVKIKASGGIRSRADAIQLIEAGASRIGTSNGIAIMKDQVIELNY